MTAGRNRSGGAATAPTSDLDLVITRVFDAPRDLAFKAWTDPEGAKAWSAPRDADDRGAGRTRREDPDDLLPGRVRVGRVARRPRWGGGPSALTNWYSTSRRPGSRESTKPRSARYEIRDLSIATGDDVAFSHSLNRVNATKTGGQKIDMWWRATICYRKLGDRWVVAHEHNSVPFDPESGKASLSLKP